MQVVILAAGKGKRLRPITRKTPKALIKINEVPILERTLNELPKEINEVIIVIGHLGEKIKNYFGKKFLNLPVKYVSQKKLLGTFHALKQARKKLRNEFLVLMADDIYSKKDLEKLIKYKRAILVKKVAKIPERFSGGCIVKRGFLKNVIKKNGVKIQYINCGAYKLTKEIFKEKKLKDSNGEQLLSYMVGSLARKKPVKAVTASFWLPIATEKDVRKAKIKMKNKATQASIKPTLPNKQ